MFEEYLQEVHAKNYMGTDDNMPDDFERWLGELDNNDLIDLANKAMTENAAKTLGSITSKKKAKTSKENGKLGGRPKKETNQ